MIEVDLEDWWTRHKLTEVGASDSTLFGAGVPLRTVLHAFVDTHLVWFTKVYGQFSDNVLLAAVERSATASIGHTVRPESRPMEEAMGKSGVFEEYALEGRAEDVLGGKLDRKTGEYTLTKTSMLQCEVLVHDDCFFWVEPANGDVIAGVTQCILQQHSFYLGTEVDWSAVSATIAQRIAQGEIVQIKSHPRRCCLTVRRTGKVTLARVFGFFKPKPRCDVLILDGRAQFVS